MLFALVKHIGIDFGGFLLRPFHFEFKIKLGSLFEFGVEVDGTVEFLDDHLADDEAKTDSVGIDVPLGVFVGAEELEQLSMVLRLNADT